MQISTKHIDYLQRSYMVEDQAETISNSKWAAALKDTLSLVKLKGRVILKDPSNTDEFPPPEMTDVLTGLHERNAAYVFITLGTENQVEFHSGSCRFPLNNSEEESGKVDLEPQLFGICPGIQTSPSPLSDSSSAIAEKLTSMSYGAIAVGSPTLKYSSDEMMGSQMDRVLRCMKGCNWAYVLISVPVMQNDLISMFNLTLNEIRAVSDSILSSGGPSPVGKSYVQQLEMLLEKINLGKSSGLWHCGTFLLADDPETLARLKAVLRGAMSGKASIPDPFFIVDAGNISEKVASLKIPMAEPPQAPGQITYPYRFLSLLNSSEVASLSQVPWIETPGFHVTKGARFDVNPHGESPQDGIHLGSVIRGGKPAGPSIVLKQKTFRRHTMIAGTTGSGKTNTIFHLLGGFAENQIPFLVIEPAKSEYRCLDGVFEYSSPFQVFTPGREGCAPLRLNPFEVPEGISVSEHIDLLRAAFSASFGLWTPLPQVLEQSLHAVYRDKGWDIVRNRNVRLESGESSTAAYPTLTELVHKVRAVTEAIGYSKETTDEIGSALITRLNALRIGGKGKMLDTEYSLPADVLFNRPTVIELEGLGADEDKAFVIALLLVRLAAYRRFQGPSHDLKHILIIEEAHRLLANVSLQREEREADPRGKAVETFVNLLAEVRAYGQGVIVADQIPVKLAPDLIKNTNLKITHRIVAETDRMVIGGSMIMSDSQEKALATLKVGEAAVFGTGDDNSIMVKVPFVESVDTSNRPSDEAVGDRMQEILKDLGPQAVRHAPCGPGCSGNQDACGIAGEIIDTPSARFTIARVILSMIADHQALHRLWQDVLHLARSHRNSSIPENDLLRCLATQGIRWFTGRRGSQAGWSFKNTRKLEEILLNILLGKIDEDQSAIDNAFEKLEKLIGSLCNRNIDPYPSCSAICTVEPPLCLYREATADLIGDGRFNIPWQSAEEDDKKGEEGYKHLWEVCMDAAYQLIEFPESHWSDEQKQKSAETARQVALCFGQQMLSDDPKKIPRTARIITDKLIKEACHE